jgi:outer membrane protein OmpA-like peptidoglycan-associated protein
MTMRVDWYFGLAAAIVLAGAWVTDAGAQTDSTASSTAGDGIIHLHMPGAQAHAPAAPSGDGAIHLHPIGRHAVNQASATAADTSSGEPAASGEASAPESSAPVHTKASHGGAASGKAAIPFNFGEDDASPPADGGTAPGSPMPSLKTASLPPHGGSSARSSSSDSEHAGLTKRGAVMFEKGATNPSPAQFDGVKLLAGDLTNALESGASRVQLEAYGGAPGDRSSDARRLSLKRALAVRQLLIDNGVPSNRIDVRAMGGADDRGPADRVDVFLRAG